MLACFNLVDSVSQYQGKDESLDELVGLLADAVDQYDGNLSKEQWTSFYKTMLNEFDRDTLDDMLVEISAALEYLSSQ